MPRRGVGAEIYGAVSQLADQTRRLEELVDRLKPGEARLAAYFNQALVGMCVTSLTKRWLEVSHQRLFVILSGFTHTGRT